MMFEESDKAIEKLSENYEDKVLRRINRYTLAINCYEKNFPNAPKYGQKIQRKIN